MTSRAKTAIQTLEGISESLKGTPQSISAPTIAWAVEELKWELDMMELRAKNAETILRKEILRKELTNH